MKDKLLDKAFILSNGIDYDELQTDYMRFGDREFIISEGKEKFFSGLTYALFPNGNLEFYAFYKEGFKEGYSVEFYDNNQIKCIQKMKRGRTYGIRQMFYSNGGKKLEAKYEYGVCLTLREWDDKGMLIKEKLQPTKEDLELRNSEEKWHKSTGWE